MKMTCKTTVLTQGCKWSWVYSCKSRCGIYVQKAPCFSNYGRWNMNSKICGTDVDLPTPCLKEGRILYLHAWFKLPVTELTDQYYLNTLANIFFYLIHTCMRFFSNSNMNYLDIMIGQVQPAKKLAREEKFILV